MLPAGLVRVGVETDAIDLEAITELVLAGRGYRVGVAAVAIGEPAAWSAHRNMLERPGWAGRMLWAEGGARIGARGVHAD